MRQSSWNTLRLSLAGPVLALLVPARVAAVPFEEPALSFHFTTPSYSGCAALEPEALSCESLVLEGNAGTMQFAWILVSHTGAIEALQFGLEYSSTVSVVSWAQCADGLSIPEAGWPATGTACAIAWENPELSTAPDSLVVVGYLTVAKGSSGLLGAAADARVGDALYQVDGVTSSFKDSTLSTADISGTGLSFNSCGFVWGDTFGTPASDLPWSRLKSLFRREGR